MNSNLNDVKRDVKNNIEELDYVRVELDEYGEGYNVYVTIFLVEDSEKESRGIDRLLCHTLSEEEKLSQAKSRIKRVVDAMEKLNVTVEVM